MSYPGDHERQEQQRRERREAQRKQQQEEEERKKRLRDILLQSPAATIGSSWILWRPGIDPVEFFVDYENRVRTKRIAALAAGTITTIVVVAVALFTVRAAFETNFWLGLLAILGGLFVGAIGLSYTYDAVGRTASTQSKRFQSYVLESFGKDCFATWEGLHGGPFASEESAARRVAAATQRIQNSYALKTGWLPNETLARAHDDAWNSLVRASKASEVAREAHLSEVAASLESVAAEVAALDTDLRSRENADELKRLQADYQAVRDRTTALSDDVVETRRYLTENPE